MTAYRTATPPEAPEPTQKKTQLAYFKESLKARWAEQRIFYQEAVIFLGVCLTLLTLVVGAAVISTRTYSFVSSSYGSNFAALIWGSTVVGTYGTGKVLAFIVSSWYEASQTMKRDQRRERPEP